EQALAAAGVEALILRVVRAPGLGRARVDITDDLAALRVQGADRRGIQHAVVVRRVALAVLVDVDVEHQRRHLLPSRERRAGNGRVDEPGGRVEALAGRADRALQLILPARDDRRLPARAGG